MARCRTAQQRHPPPLYRLHSVFARHASAEVPPGAGTMRDPCASLIKRGKRSFRLKSSCRAEPTPLSPYITAIVERGTGYTQRRTPKNRAIVENRVDNVDNIPEKMWICSYRVHNQCAVLFARAGCLRCTLPPPARMSGKRICAHLVHISYTAPRSLPGSAVRRPSVSDADRPFPMPTAVARARRESRPCDRSAKRQLRRTLQQQNKRCAAKRCAQSRRKNKTASAAGAVRRGNVMCG